VGKTLVSSFNIAFMTLAFSVAGITFGCWFRKRLPDHHLRDDAKDVVKNATGMIATLVALVIGLLVSSSKSSFDQVNAGLTQIGAKVIMLDSLLARYGPDSAQARSQLRSSVTAVIDRIQSAEGALRVNPATVGASPALEEAYDNIRAWNPDDDAHRYLQAQALQICADILQSRWLLIEGAQTSLPRAFLVVLIFWLAVLFLGLGLQTPNSLTPQIALFVCALSMSGAVFLILEMSRPMEGTIRVSPGALLKAQSLLGG
jgi:hypothetical protein